jgi:hypothetical protein
VKSLHNLHLFGIAKPLPCRPSIRECYKRNMGRILSPIHDGYLHGGVWGHETDVQRSSRELGSGQNVNRSMAICTENAVLLTRGREVDLGGARGDTQGAQIFAMGPHFSLI